MSGLLLSNDEFLTLIDAGFVFYPIPIVVYGYESIEAKHYL